MSAVLVTLDLHSRAPGLNPSLSDVDAARLIGSRPLPDCTEAATAP